MGAARARRQKIMHPPSSTSQHHQAADLDAQRGGKGAATWLCAQRARSGGFGRRSYRRRRRCRWSWRFEVATITNLKHFCILSATRDHFEERVLHGNAFERVVLAARTAVRPPPRPRSGRRSGSFQRSTLREIANFIHAASRPRSGAAGSATLSGLATISLTSQLRARKSNSELRCCLVTAARAELLSYGFRYSISLPEMLIC